MSDLDEEINNATISFVPQVGDGKKKKREPKSGGYTDPGAGSPPAGYGHNNNNNQNNNYPPMHGGSNIQQYQHQGPPQGMPGFQQFPPPPNPYQNDVHYAQGPPQKQYQHMQNPYQQQQPMMGQPVMMGSPISDYQQYPQAGAYPQAGSYAPGQPGAMVLLVQEAPDLDFQAPLFSFETCVGCLNHWFLTYCQLARQQNMIRVLNSDPSAIQRSHDGCKSMVNEQRAQEHSRKLPSYNGCCAAALTFDVGSLVLGFFFPQFFGASCISGICIETLQVRQQIRARFGIMPHQFQDCLVGCCCQPCASAQHQQELMMRCANPNLVCGDEQPNRALRRIQ